MDNKITDWVCPHCKKGAIEEVCTGLISYSRPQDASVIDGVLYVDDYTSSNYQDGEFSHYECHYCGKDVMESDIIKFLEGEK